MQFIVKIDIIIVEDFIIIKNGCSPILFKIIKYYIERCNKYNKYTITSVLGITKNIA